MSKFFLISLLLIGLLIQAGNSQLITGYGVKLGATHANQIWTYAPQIDIRFYPDSRWGLNGGIFAEFLHVPFFSMVGEVNYTQKGMKYHITVTSPSDPSGTGETVTLDNRLDYLDLRVLVKLYKNYSQFSPYLLAGPRLDYQVAESVAQEFESIFKDFKKEIYGISMGAGFEISSIISLPILVEFIYNYDLSKLYETENLTIKNEDFEIRAGIKF
jgi:Outer membrane protein beta-barrel domain